MPHRYFLGIHLVASCIYYTLISSGIIYSSFQMWNIHHSPPPNCSFLGTGTPTICIPNKDFDLFFDCGSNLTVTYRAKFDTCKGYRKIDYCCSNSIHIGDKFYLQLNQPNGTIAEKFSIEVDDSKMMALLVISAALWFPSLIFCFSLFAYCEYEEARGTN